MSGNKSNISGEPEVVEIHTNENSGDGAALERKTKEKEARLGGDPEMPNQQGKDRLKVFPRSDDKQVTGGSPGSVGAQDEGSLQQQLGSATIGEHASELILFSARFFYRQLCTVTSFLLSPIHLR